MSHDLKVVGAGHLGVRIALLWQQKFPDAAIYLTTRTNNEQRTAKWKAQGFHVSSREQEESGEVEIVKVPFVVFCAPPTGNPNYPETIQHSIDVDREISSNGGAYLFTSSTGVYAENSGGVVNEKSAVASPLSDRQSTQLKVEQNVLASCGGVVLRYAGLYSKLRGAHNYWLRYEGERLTRPSRPNGLINLVHYDDAARCAVDVFLKVPSLTGSERLFVVSDGVAISRADICAAALKCKTYSNNVSPDFQGGPGVDGKRCDTSSVTNVIGWKPLFQTFAGFMENQYEDEMDIEMFL